jgi:hypothetical protein
MMIVAQLLFLISLVAFIWLLVVAFKRSVLWGLAVLLLSPITAIIYALKFWDESKKPFGVYASTFVAGFLTFAYVFTSWGGMAVMDAAMDFDQGDGKTLNEAAAFEFANASLDFIENADESQSQDVAAMRDFIQAMEAGEPDQAACGMYREMLGREQTDEAEALIRRNMEEMGCAADQARPEEKVAEPTNTTEQPQVAQGTETKPWLPVEPERVRYEQVFKPVDVARAAEYVGTPVLVTRHGKQQECMLVQVDGRKLVFEQRIGSGTMTFSYHESDISALEALTTVQI